MEKGKEKLYDFVEVIEPEFDVGFNPPSPPRDTFQEDEATKVLVDLDSSLIPRTIPLEEAVDERLIASMQFMSNDNFSNTLVFKSFWMREKLKGLCRILIEKVLSVPLKREGNW